MSDAHDFFSKHVEPAVAAWRSDDLNEQLAMSAAVNLSHMAEHYLRSFTVGDPKLLGASKLDQLRTALDRRAPAFSIIRDVADAHKHVSLDRKGRQLTSADQTAVGSMGFGEAEFGYGKYGGGTELVVELDSGEKRHFSALVDATLAMWRGLLS
jgi:hypothetical protein